MSGPKPPSQSKSKSSLSKLGESAQSARQDFAQNLVILRSKLGYSSAYGFYHKLGGKKVLLVSYLQYRLIERGLRLPSVSTFEALLNALTNSVTYRPQRMELMLRYCRALVDANPVFEELWSELKLGIQQLSGSGHLTEVFKGMWNVEARMADEAAKQIVRDVPRMSTQLVEITQRSPAHFWVWQWLLQTGRDETADSLTRHLGLRTSEVMGALKDLKAGKLVVEGQGKDTYRSPHFERNLFEPHQQMSLEQRQWLSDLFNQRAKDQKTEHHSIYQLVTAVNEDVIELMSMNLYSLNRRILQLRPPSRPKSGKLVVLHSRVIPLFEVPEEAPKGKRGPSSEDPEDGS